MFPSTSNTMQSGDSGERAMKRLYEQIEQDRMLDSLRVPRSRIEPDSYSDDPLGLGHTGSRLAPSGLNATAMLPFSLAPMDRLSGVAAASYPMNPPVPYLPQGSTVALAPCGFDASSIYASMTNKSVRLPHTTAYPYAPTRPIATEERPSELVSFLMAHTHRNNSQPPASQLGLNRHSPLEDYNRQVTLQRLLYEQDQRLPQATALEATTAATSVAPLGSLPQLKAQRDDWAISPFAPPAQTHGYRQTTASPGATQLQYISETPQVGVTPKHANMTKLPATLAHPDDHLYLSSHQVFMRQQIEVFEATEMDTVSHTRGRNTRIQVGQVGIRCRFCAHVTGKKQKGTIYFPATTMGLYQAAQNMSAMHLQCGVCTHMPDDVKMKFVEVLPSKTTGSLRGRSYWSNTAKSTLGLVDTDKGIRIGLQRCS